MRIKHSTNFESAESVRSSNVVNWNSNIFTSLVSSCRCWKWVYPVTGMVRWLAVYAATRVLWLVCTTGADVNKATTNHDHTVLSLACAGGHIGVVELLLKHGANVMQKLKVWRQTRDFNILEKFSILTCPMWIVVYLFLFSVLSENELWMIMLLWYCKHSMSCEW